MADAADGNALSGPEFPTEDRLRIYGDFLFLAMRSDHHRRMSVATLREAIEPPILLGQYHVFRFDGIPRGLFTWGLLGPQAEERLVSGEGLAAEDWRSGPNLWIVDLMSPYRGLASGMVRWIMTPGNLVQRRFHFRRLSGGRDTRRIVEIDLDRESKARVMTEDEFLSAR
jgi:cytolysin-activating lysine-acyltransferase